MATNSNRVAIGIFASRAAGMVREVFIQAVFGSGSAAVEAFRAAMRIPNLVQNLLGEGALSASFVPVYAKLLEDDDKVEAQKVAAGTLGYLSALVALLVAVLVVLARPIVRLTTPGFGPSSDKFELTVAFTRITAVGVGFVTLAAFCLGVLNAHRRFLLAYSAPIAWNGVQILALGGLYLFGSVAVDDPASLERGARLLSYAMVIGSLAQLAVLWPSANRLAGGLVPHLRREGGVKTVLRRAGPAVTGRGVVQLSSFIDLLLASFLVSGALNGLQSTLVFYLLPISLFGFSVAAAELTEMSRSSDQVDHVARRVALGLRKVELPAGFVTPLFVAGGPAVVGAAYGIFGRGADANNLTFLGLVLASFGLGLPAAMCARITQNALYAVGDVRGPARIAAIRLAVVALAGTILMFQFDRLTVTDAGIVGWGEIPVAGPLPRIIRDASPAFPHLGAVGLGIGSSIAAWVEWGMLRSRLNRKFGRPIVSGLLFPIAAAGALSGVMVLAVGRLGLPNPMAGIIAGLVGLGTYVGALAFQGYRPIHR